MTALAGRVRRLRVGTVAVEEQSGRRAEEEAAPARPIGGRRLRLQCPEPWRRQPSLRHRQPAPPATSAVRWHRRDPTCLLPPPPPAQLD
ncbi:hypothetical protein P7K49_024420 [Saguinus oedipus]|uniref:Uncharacterized protein n=1 Tax=Saguinus oedipus TaxID=9490 RepID=A0ABQ9UPF4_SAGOE|nr:hypothetical protein P7K49_024420 [Saguinus oedipus]